MSHAAPQSMSRSNIARTPTRWRRWRGAGVVLLTTAWWAALPATAHAADHPDGPALTSKAPVFKTPAAAASDAAANAGGTTVRLRPAPRYTGNYIVRWRDGQAPSSSTVDTASRMRQLEANTGVAMSVKRQMGGAFQLLSVANAGGQDPEAVAARLRQDPRIADAVPDRWLRIQDTIPNDPDFASGQVYLGPPSQVAGGVNLPRAWDRTRGNSALVIAVVDTGYLPHADLAGRLVPGYDFITSPTVSNDGDGRDGDPTDAGDNELAGSNCGGTVISTAQPNSWHGTRVASVLGAITNNGANMAGVDWNARIQPVRVSGRCGAQLSDTVDGMRWAGGLSVPGVADNPTPARVINVSLGGGTCSSVEQQAVNDLAARGVVVVAASGNIDPNNPQDIAVEAPADCAGVIAVTAHANDGENASFARVGPAVAISAPGGGCGNSKVQNGACVGGQSFIRTLSNTGKFALGTDTEVASQGTSFATPMVSGVVALMLAANPSLTPAQVTRVLQSSARPHPANTYCTMQSTQVCGAGLLDADAAVTLAPTPPAAATPPPAAQPVASDGGGGGGAVTPWAGLLLALAGVAGFALRRQRGATAR